MKNIFYFYENFVCILNLIGIYTFPAKQIASSSNGRTADSDSVNRGSNPCEAAIKKQPRFGAFFVAISMGENHDLWFGFPPFAPWRREGTRQAPKGCAVAVGRAHNPCEAAIKKQPRFGAVFVAEQDYNNAVNSYGFSQNYMLQEMCNQYNELKNRR